MFIGYFELLHFDSSIVAALPYLNPDMLGPSDFKACRECLF